MRRADVHRFSATIPLRKGPPVLQWRGMSKGFLPHCDDLLGYTMPLVIRILEQGYPERLSDIPKSFVGPLKVTLAQDLAIAGRHVLLEGSLSRFRENLRTRLMRKYGGVEYVSGSDTVTQLEKRLNEIHSGLVDADREAYGWHDHMVKEGPAKSVSPDPYGKPVRWLVFNEASKARVGKLRSRIHVLLKWKRLTTADIRIHKEKLRAIEDAVSARADYQAEFESNKWRLAADFSTAIGWQSEGSTHYLRNLESKWWDRFTRAFEEAVAADAAKPFRVALREYPVIEGIKTYVHGAKNWCHAAAAYFENNRGDWWEEAPTVRSIEKCRLELAHDDLFVLRWAKGHGHPRTFYAQWAHDIINKAPSEQYFAPSRLSKKWAETVQGLLPSEPMRDNDAVRLNELQWVLSRGGTGPYQFQLYGGNREQWKAHGLNWWCSITDAGGGRDFPADTKYFCR